MYIVNYLCKKILIIIKYIYSFIETEYWLQHKYQAKIWKQDNVILTFPINLLGMFM